MVNDAVGDRATGAAPEATAAAAAATAPLRQRLQDVLRAHAAATQRLLVALQQRGPNARDTAPADAIDVAEARAQVLDAERALQAALDDCTCLPTGISRDTLDSRHLVLLPSTTSVTPRVVEAHQKFQQQINAQEAALRAEDQRLLQLATLLQRAEETLDAALTSAEAVLERARAAQQGEPIGDARQVALFYVCSAHKVEHQRTLCICALIGSVDTAATLEYARKISYTTAPPPHWPGTGPMVPHEPPVPSDQAIRSSLLYRTYLASRGVAPGRCCMTGWCSPLQNAHETWF